MTLLRGDRPSQAIPIFERALVVSPDDPSLWFECSRAYYAERRLEETRTCIERAIELTPEAENYRRALDRLNQVIGSRPPP
ncbi:tetratricopeptide repeat protein [Bradyrhizobium oligotrophicum]|uniref:tetratricopeptide repeat protein n=1 Tax=Bradyrhizobium oligotrophicum TaxID=44255 RepID=UPI003EBC9C50